MASRRPNFAVLAYALVLSCAFVPVLTAQGCSQCRDNVAQENPAVQASYREAILILLGATAALATTAVVVIRKLR